MAAVKVTLTLPDDLLAAVDRYLAQHPEMSRSGVCAGALREWLRAEQELEIERYYAEMGDEERAENEAWAQVAAASAAASAGSLWR